MKDLKIMNKILKGFKGFCIGETSSIESRRLIVFCNIHNIPLIIGDKKDIYSKEYVPSGGVDWVLKILDKSITPDYYPSWLSQYLYRKTWREDKWILGEKLFVKPADRYKRFTGFVTRGTYSKKKKPPLIWSEVVHFVNEWRYYISNGKILCGEWYWGDELNTPEAPLLDIDIPNYFCGAVDFGMLEDGRLSLIESQHPFSCGWYGEQEKDYLYFQWLVDGWEYMLKL